MNKISKYLQKHLIEKYPLTVTVKENEDIVSMSKETFEEILTDQSQLIYTNIFYTFMILFTVVGFLVIISLT